MTHASSLRLGIRPRFAILALCVPSAFTVAGLWFTTCMPGSARPEHVDGELPADSKLLEELRGDVRALADTIGERNVAHPAALTAARRHVEAQLRDVGLAPTLETYSVCGVPCSNVVAEIAGSTRRDEIVVVGAHYDSIVGSPGANDNATGTAALIALARRAARTHPARTLRFVAFVNEEPPWFQTDAMGSRVHARASKARGDHVVAMLSLDTLGCYSSLAGSQHYPAPVLHLAYPSRGDFVTFVGNLASRRLLRDVIGAFRASARIPSEGGALPEFVSGVGWSDHESFWREGYDALMVTDTAVYRDPRYHQASDMPGAVDFDGLERVVEGLVVVLAHLCAH